MRITNSPTLLGTAIRERRGELKLTQDDLALAIGVIGQLERGKETVQLGIALNAARAVGLNVGVEARGDAHA